MAHELTVHVLERRSSVAGPRWPGNPFEGGIRGDSGPATRGALVRWFGQVQQGAG